MYFIGKKIKNWVFIKEKIRVTMNLMRLYSAMIE